MQTAFLFICFGTKFRFAEYRLFIKIECDYSQPESVLQAFFEEMNLWGTESFPLIKAIPRGATSDSEVIYNINFTAKPAPSRSVLHPIMSRVFAFETVKSLRALKKILRIKRPAKNQSVNSHTENQADRIR